VQEFHIQIVCKKTIPPGKVVSDHQNRLSCVIELTLDVYLTEMPLNAENGVLAEKPGQKGIVSGFDHFVGLVLVL
jgi:hypothetical protein